MSMFSNKMHGVMVTRKPIQLMEISLLQITWHNVSNRHMRQLIFLSAWYAAWLTWSPGAPPDAMFNAKSTVLLNNLKHCNHTIIISIVHNCIALLKINMHVLFILWLIWFLIYFIKFLIKTLLNLFDKYNYNHIFSKHFGLCLLFATLKRLIRIFQYCDRYYCQFNFGLYRPFTS